jgi:hypothetical protein
MARRLVVLALAAVFLAAGAGLADAKKGETPAPPDVPAQAVAKGLAKRAPATDVDEAPTAAPSRVAASPRGGAASPADDEPRASSLATHSVPTPPSREERVEVLFGAPGGAALAGPRAAPGIGLPGTSAGDDGAPWWVALLWALPFVGIGGTGAVLLMRRKGAGAITHGSSRIAMAPVEPSDLSGLLRNGHAAVARGALDEAVAWFDAALRLAPTLAVAHFCKGVCLAANGRVSEAYGALDEAVYAAPDDATYRVHFARVALALGKHNEAMDALALVAREMPDLGPAMLEDAQLAGLRDHPRFLMICGAL